MHVYACARTRTHTHTNNDTHTPRHTHDCECATRRFAAAMAARCRKTGRKGVLKSKSRRTWKFSQRFSVGPIVSPACCCTCYPCKLHRVCQLDRVCVCVCLFVFRRGIIPKCAISVPSVSIAHFGYTNKRQPNHIMNRFVSCMLIASLAVVSTRKYIIALFAHCSVNDVCVGCVGCDRCDCGANWFG